MNNAIYVSEKDARRIKALIDLAPRVDERTKGYLAYLEQELNRANIVAESELPQNVITLNSEVELEDLSDGELMTYTLVFPEEADPASGKISILAPLGTGMLGYQAGDDFEWETPGGKARFKVLSVKRKPVVEFGQTVE